ncbi:unnamed protein product [Rotaria sp. Silwood2]|nr:unnamed protein product [Rotaria sp. Silwood2]
MVFYHHNILHHHPLIDYLNISIKSFNHFIKKQKTDYLIPAISSYCRLSFIQRRSCRHKNCSFTYEHW